MSLTRPSTKSRNAWKRLTKRRRLGAVFAAAELFRTTGQRRRLGSGVTSVGAGWRERGGASDEAAGTLTREPVLVVTVKRKWQKGDRTRKRSRRIPGWIEVEIELAGKLVTVAIPTDVREAPASIELHILSQAMYIEPGEPALGPSPINGCAAAVLASLSGEFHLLGCTHVIARTKVTDARPDTASKPFTVATMGGGPRTLGRVGLVAPFDPARRDNLDAATIVLDSAGQEIALHKRFWSYLPTGHADDAEAVADLGVEFGSFYLVGAGHRTVALEFSQVAHGLRFQYGSIAVEIHEVLEFKSANHGQVPMPGDSGGAVYAGNAETIVGVHIGGDPTRGSGYAIPIYRLVEGDAFPEQLTLVTKGSFDG